MEKTLTELVDEAAMKRDDKRRTPIILSIGELRRWYTIDQIKQYLPTYNGQDLTEPGNYEQNMEYIKYIYKNGK